MGSTEDIVMKISDEAQEITNEIKMLKRLNKNKHFLANINKPLPVIITDGYFLLSSHPDEAPKKMYYL